VGAVGTVLTLVCCLLLCVWLSHAVFKSKGRIYCTTQRIIFVAEKGVTQHGCYFEAFVRLHVLV
jgi:hypothetical protein